MPDKPLQIPEEINEPLPEDAIDQDETGAVWVGSPEAAKSDDGISDLFEVDSDSDTDDLVSVDMETDIIDGPLDDLTDVSEKDIMGDEIGQVPLEHQPNKKRIVRRMVRRRTLQGDAGMGGLNAY